MMQVVFTKPHGSAREFDIRTVRDGYALFLLKYSYADIATKSLVESAQKKLDERKRKLDEEISAAQVIAAKLSAITLEFAEKANEDGHLFGSITEAMVAEKLTEALGSEVKKDQVRMGDHLKEVGDHDVNIYFIDTVTAPVKVSVTAISE